MSLSSGQGSPSIQTIWQLLVRLWWRLLIIGGSLFALYRLRGVIVVLCFTAIIAYILHPLVDWLTHRPGFTLFHSEVAGWWVSFKSKLTGKPVPKSPPVSLKRHAVTALATVYVFIFAFIAVWQLGSLLSRPFVSEVKNLTSPTGQKFLVDKKDEFIDWYDNNAPDWAQSDQVQEQVKKADLAAPLRRLGAESGKFLMEGFKGIVEIALMPVLAFYILIDGRKLKHEFVGLLPRRHVKETTRILNEFNRIMRAFIAGQFMLCLIAAVVVGIGLHFLKMPFAFLLGIFAGITRAIPVIGPIIGAIPIILLALTSPNGVGIAIGVAIFFSILHIVETKFIMPILIGDKIDLHPVVIIVVLLIGAEFGSLLLGGLSGVLLGMFFAAPIASLIRVILRRYVLRIPANKISMH